MKNALTVATLAVAIASSSIDAGAQTPQANDLPVVVTVGEGIVKRVPDQAWVMIAAESRAKTPTEAQKLNADAMNAVQQKLKGVGLPADAIQTERRLILSSLLGFDERGYRDREHHRSIDH